MFRFEYHKASSLEMATELLSGFGSAAKVLAGGTDLLVAIRKGKCETPKAVVDITSIPYLSQIEFGAEGECLVGATVTVARLTAEKHVSTEYHAVWEAGMQLGSPQIRNVATVGGNLCNASPAAELAPPLLVFDARLLVQGRVSQRVVPIADFFLGPGQTVLRSDEVLRAIILPPAGAQGVGSAYKRVSLRRALDIAIASAAAFIRVGAGGVIEDCRVGLGAVAPTPLRAKEAERKVVGRAGSDDLFRRAGAEAAKECLPIDDIRGSAEYRRAMVEVLTSRALSEAYRRAVARQGGSV